MLKNDLVWVPSKVIMVNKAKNISKTLEEPKALLVLCEGETMYEVLYEGVSWAVAKSAIFHVEREGERND